MRGAHQQQVPGGGIGSAGTACRRRQRSKPALLLLLLALCCQELAQRGAEAAGLAAEAAPKGSRRVAPGASKHITVRGRVRGGSLTFSRNNPALDQLLEEYSERHEAAVRDAAAGGPAAGGGTAGAPTGGGAGAPQPAPQRRYVLTTMSDAYGGLGNQLPSMVNGFLLALLTNRTFFIDYPLHARFFTHPNLDFTWANHTARLLGGGAGLTRAIFHEQPFGSDFYLTTDFGGPAYVDKDILEINCDGDYESAPLLSNLKYVAFREKYFPNGEVFHALAAFLLHPAPILQDQVEAVKRDLFRPLTIGLQIRKWKGHGEGGFDWAPPPSVRAFASAAKALQRQRGVDDASTAFFIASDAAEVYEEATQLLGAEQVIRTRNGVGETNWNGNPGSPESALLDWKLLTECDDLLITVGSSFGQIAAAYSGIAPVNLVHGKHENVHNPYFFRALNSEPCYYGSKGVLARAPESSRAALQANPLWVQYASCH